MYAPKEKRKEDMGTIALGTRPPEDEESGLHVVGGGQALLPARGPTCKRADQTCR